jgi:hypothetical protein
MRRFLARFSIRLMIALVLLVGAARVVGGFMPNPAEDMLRQFECEPQPCWNAIHIGSTSLEQAQRILSADPTIRFVDFQRLAPSICWVWTNEWHRAGSEYDGCYELSIEQSDSLALNFATSALRLGDVLPVMGTPLNSDMGCFEGHEFALVYSGSMTVYLTDDQPMLGLVADMPVTTIAIFSKPIDILEDQLRQFRWSGFSRWDQIDPFCLR